METPPPRGEGLEFLERQEVRRLVRPDRVRLVIDHMEPGIRERLARQAELFRALHHGDRLLVLPNVWDAASAGVAAAAGFPALATGSAAVAAVLGHPDHEGAPPEEMFAAARRIVDAVDVPVTVDAEAGYGLSPAELVHHLIDVGAAGCNLEDSDHWGGGLIPAETQANRIAAVRSAAATAGVPLVLNARVDVYLQEGGSRQERMQEAVRRAGLYLDAGADVIYPIKAPDAETIQVLTRSIPAPVNVLYGPGTPGLADLARCGVARVTFGPGLHRAVMDGLHDILTRLARGGDPYARPRPRPASGGQALLNSGPQGG